MTALFVVDASRLERRTGRNDPAKAVPAGPLYRGGSDACGQSIVWLSYGVKAWPDHMPALTTMSRTHLRMAPRPPRTAHTAPPRGDACRRFRLRSPLGRIEVLQSSSRRCPGLAFVSMNAIAPVGRCRVRIMRQKTNDVHIPTSTTTLEVRPGKSSGSRTRTKRRANLTSNPALFIRGSFRFP